MKITDLFHAYFGKPSKRMRRDFDSLKSKFTEQLTDKNIAGLLRTKYLQHLKKEKELEQYEKDLKKWASNRKRREQVKKQTARIDSSKIEYHQKNKLIAKLIYKSRRNNPALHEVFALQNKLPKATLKEFKAAQNKKYYERMKGFPSSHKVGTREYNPQRDYRNEILFDLDELFKENKNYALRYRDILSCANYLFPCLFRKFSPSMVKDRLLYMTGTTKNRT